MFPLPTIHKRHIENGLYPAEGFDCIHIRDGELFPVDESTFLKAFYTPGHTDDHVSFIISSKFENTSSATKTTNKCKSNTHFYSI